MQPLPFPTVFEALTGNSPFPWQSALYDRFVTNRTPAAADIPTGLGKTSIIAVWLIALANHPDHTPRRLVYVVNRRTVVDQTTAEAERLRKALEKPKLAEVRNALVSLCALPLPTPDAPPLAISTLRGQFADNGEWCVDPSRPAVVVGTVDMIGSGLLFSRYTRGFKTRPLHAGFLGQDTLLIHDEAHLEPAFQALLSRIVSEQARCGDLRRLRIIELTATSRAADTKRFGLDEYPDAKDTENSTVKKRFNAVKRLSLVALKDGEKLYTKLVALAKNRPVGRAVLIFTRSVESVLKVTTELDKGEHKGKVLPLTGTLRGKERDELVSQSSIFQRFLAPQDRADGVTPTPGTVFLVANSAGEVGINFSGGDLISDLSTYESMAQRFGRVNRFGEYNDGDSSEIIVVHETDFDVSRPIEVARERTLALLKKLEKNDRSASPAALDKLDAADRAAAFSPEPNQRVATEIQFDAWALTSIRERIAARPPVAPYIHGEAEWQLPETHLAWRDDRDFLRIATPEDFLEKFRLRPCELLRDTTKRIVATLEKLLHGKTDLPVAWQIGEDGSVSPFPLSDFDKDTAEVVLAETTLLLPVSIGGLENGLFTGKGSASDVSGITRLESDTREHAEFALDISDEDSDEPRFLLWFVPQSSGGIGVRSSRHASAETLSAHTDNVTANADAIAARAFPERSRLTSNEPDLRRCLVLAARLHDLGKNRAQWQRNLGNLNYDSTRPETILAKSAPGMARRNVAEHYRHEFGSLKDASADAEFSTLSETEREIVLHIVAAHHGRARPHFPSDEIGDSSSTSEADARLATEIPRRFARLQKRFGRWGLVWLESLLRAADYAASAGIVAQGGTATATSAKRTPTLGGQRKIAPTATVVVNPSNPGHYFACCGLFELAARLAPEVLAWFEQDTATRQWHFHLANTSPFAELLTKITDAEIAVFNPEDATASPLEIGKPFNVRLDWWKTCSRDASALKVWAGTMEAPRIARGMQAAVKIIADGTEFAPEKLLFDFRIAYDPADNTKKVEPFYFDANRGPNAHSRDVGFAANDLQLETLAAPAVELLTLVGLQRTIPVPVPEMSRNFDYRLWANPLCVSLLPAAVNGLLPDNSRDTFRFESWFRTGQRKHKAFLTARTISSR